MPIAALMRAFINVTMVKFLSFIEFAEAQPGPSKHDSCKALGEFRMGGVRLRIAPLLGSVAET